MTDPEVLETPEVITDLVEPTPEVPETPETPETPEAPEVVYNFDDFEEPEIPETPETPQTPTDPNWEQELKQGAAETATQLMNAAMDNRDQLMANVQDLPPQVKQFAMQQFRKLPAQGKAHPRSVQLITTLAYGAEALARQKAAPKSSVSSQASTGYTPQEQAIINQRADRLIAAGMDPAKARKEAASMEVY